jgi:hypothetical protein
MSARDQAAGSASTVVMRRALARNDDRIGS